jgi:TatD DNase family protein
LPALVDIGINLSHDSYDADREAVLRRALDAGVEQMIVTGASLASSRDAQTLVDALPQVLRATAGCHPHRPRRRSVRRVGDARTRTRGRRGG